MMFLRMIAGEAVPVNTGIFTNDMITFRIKDDVLTLLIHLGIWGIIMQKRLFSFQIMIFA